MWWTEKMGTAVGGWVRYLSLGELAGALVFAVADQFDDAALVGGEAGWWVVLVVCLFRCVGVRGRAESWIGVVICCRVKQTAGCGDLGSQMALSASPSTTPFFFLGMRPGQDIPKHHSPSHLLDDGPNKLRPLARLALALRRAGLGDTGGGFLCRRSGAAGQPVGSQLLTDGHGSRGRGNGVIDSFFLWKPGHVGTCGIGSTVAVCHDNPPRNEDRRTWPLLMPRARPVFSGFSVCFSVSLAMVRYRRVRVVVIEVAVVARGSCPGGVLVRVCGVGAWICGFDVRIELWGWLVVAGWHKVAFQGCLAPSLRIVNTSRHLPQSVSSADLAVAILFFLTGGCPLSFSKGSLWPCQVGESRLWAVTCDEFQLFITSRIQLACILPTVLLGSYIT